MKIPKVISKNGHEYILEKQVNDTIFLYKDMLYGYRECFCKHELGLIEKQPKMIYAKKHYII